MRTSLVRCNNCKNEIPPGHKFIDASHYGIDICIKCFKIMTAHEFAKLLDLDDIYWKTIDSDNQSRLINTHPARLGI